MEESGRAPVMPYELWREAHWDELAQQLELAAPAALRAVAAAAALAALASVEDERLQVALSALDDERYGDEEALAAAFSLAEEYDESEETWARARAVRALAGALEEDPVRAARCALAEGRCVVEDERSLAALIIEALRSAAD